MAYRKMPRLVICLVLALSVFFFQSLAVLAGVQQIDYVALGDSLAAGMTPTGGFDLGYPDYIAGKLADDGQLGSFDNFGVAGYTTKHVLAALVYNVAPDPARGRELVQIQEKISQAEIVTIDAGANDVLPYAANPELVVTKIAEAGDNLGKIIDQVKLLNPGAKTYVMGYYNPFPYYPEAQQQQLEALLDILNGTIEQAAIGKGAIYIPTAQTIARHTKLYLPLENIHLSKQGYMAVANDFWSNIKLDLKGE